MFIYCWSSGFSRIHFVRAHSRVSRARLHPFASARASRFNQINHWQRRSRRVTLRVHFDNRVGKQSFNLMSQHRSLRAVATMGGKRNVLKRFERVELLKRRGQWKTGDRVTGLRKTKPEA